MLNIVDFGAVANAPCDCSKAIQAAINKAFEMGESVYIPSGRYLCKDIQVLPKVNIHGDHAWSFRENGGSILQLFCDQAQCVLDITKARGCTIDGICIEGNLLGNNIHGIMTKRECFPEHEDGFCIENCRVNGFSGDACHLEKIWCVTIRHNMLSHSNGNGLYWIGWDGFVLDNWLSGNKKAGFMSDDWMCAVTMTGNRIEWNNKGGVYIVAGAAVQISNCSFDRNGGPGVYFASEMGYVSDNLIINSCIFNRNGAASEIKDELQNSHIYVCNCTAFICTSNAFKTGQDDDKKGKFSPLYGAVINGLTDAVIKDNVYSSGVFNSFIKDMGNHKSELIIKDNIGSIAKK